MTKEQLFAKWTINPDFKYDLDAVISTEIEKAQEVEPEKAKPQPALNPIADAYERGKKIRGKNWDKEKWVLKKDDEYAITNDSFEIPLSKSFLIHYPTQWELYTEPEQVTDHVQHELNPISEAYERGDKIRKKTWEKDAWIKKHTEIMSIHDDACLRKKVWYNFDTYPNLWELYTEPTEQPSSQAKHDNSFDRERFEAMFRAVVASGRTESYEQDFLATNICLEKLDAFYASKEGGNNE